jgi:hypothetical protein
MGWSVLTEPNSKLGEDVRAALGKLSPDTRTGLAHGLGTIVNRHLEKEIHPWFSKGTHDWADVDVYAAEMREGALVLHFIADHYNYNFAQSGSDWADHYVFVGKAHLVGGKRKHETFALERHIHLTEHEHDDYDRRNTVDAVRGEMLEKMYGRNPRKVASGPEQAGGAGARKVASDTPASSPAESESTYRCPKCRSARVEFNPIFDAYQLKCESCGHSQVIETYPEQESDAEWIAPRKD